MYVFAFIMYVLYFEYAINKQYTYIYVYTGGMRYIFGRWILHTIDSRYITVIYNTIIHTEQ